MFGQFTCLVAVLFVSACWSASLLDINRRHPEDEINRADLADMLLDNSCDNGKDNLTIDWDGSVDAYTCMGDQFPNSQAPPIYYTDDEPVSKHVCTSKSIPEYKDKIPTSGPHRPVWPQFGEYRYIPPQRWLHALEHGSIVLLYHPCADKSQVQLLRETLTGCMWRHIITPYNKLSSDYPFALVAWGNSLQLGHADERITRDFIKEHALQANVGAVYDGFFNNTLIHHSNYVSDKDDSVICPE